MFVLAPALISCGDDGPKTENVKSLIVGDWLYETSSEYDFEKYDWKDVFFYFYYILLVNGPMTIINTFK